MGHVTFTPMGEIKRTAPLSSFIDALSRSLFLLLSYMRVWAVPNESSPYTCAYHIFAWALPFLVILQPMKYHLLLSVVVPPPPTIEDPFMTASSL